MCQNRSICLDRDNKSNHLGLFTLCWTMKINYKNSHYLWRTYGWCYSMLIRLLKLNKLISFFSEGLFILIDFLWIDSHIRFLLFITSKYNNNKKPVCPMVLQYSSFSWTTLSNNHHTSLVQWSFHKYKCLWGVEGKN